jgi:glycyl-tRNA synthetase beta chain
MPDLFLELFSEEIPARMQARAAEDLSRLLSESLAALAPSGQQIWYGPRRIACAMQVASEVAATASTERGPRVAAPEAALAGFLRKHHAVREDLRQEGDFWVLEKRAAATGAAALIATAIPALLRRFPWPKSMRWGHSPFMWVRPLRRIVCLLDGVVVPFTLAEGDDAAHGLCSGDQTEGHRFHARGPFSVSGATDWQEKLAQHFVIADAAARKTKITQDLAALAAAQGVSVVADAGLLDEVAGLVERPVAFLGRIDAQHMDLPPEVMQVSMRVNQRYFALRDGNGNAAPWFGFIANLQPDDGGAAVIAGNERVLRARFSDARHFWDLDRKTKLIDRLPALDGVTFHAKLGTQGERARRIAAIAGQIAARTGADVAKAERAGLLAKADLTSGMVGEFPELQGIMGGYYARNDGEADAVADAVRDHYLPKGPNDPVPSAPVSIAVALADKLDALARFFAIGEKPSGSGDPFALRRAALGVLRIIRENNLRLPLRGLLADADAADAEALIGFLADRLLVQLRAEGKRHDLLAAVFAAGGDDDVVRLLARTDAVASLLGTEDGGNLLAAYRRAANILRIEEKKDGAAAGAVNPALLTLPEEKALHDALGKLHATLAPLLEAENYAAAMQAMAELRAPLDAFFDKVTVNAAEPELRRNRLALLSVLRQEINQIADFSRIEG